VWKEYKLLGRIDRETALSLIKAIGNVLTVIKMESIKGFEDEVFSLACKENLTIYDASYLYTSIKMQATLITDDQKLREKSSKYIKVLNTEQLIQHATRKPKRT